MSIMESLKAPPLLSPPPGVTLTPPLCVRRFGNDGLFATSKTASAHAPPASAKELLGEAVEAVEHVEPAPTPPALWLYICMFSEDLRLAAVRSSSEEPDVARMHMSCAATIRQHTSAYVSVCQHTSAYVSIQGSAS
jgi:hypothetical protein